MKNKLFKKNTQNQKGFTLLFAVLVSTLVLAVGTSIITVALKQISLSGSARDSQFAFYAANTGVECGIFWDFSGIEGYSEPVFATSSGNPFPTGNVNCGATSVEIGGADWDVDSVSNAATTTFRVNLTDVPYCADIIVSKYEDSGNIKTTIDSRGYNTCDENSKRRIERGLRITY